MLLIDSRVGSRELAAHIPKGTPFELTRLEYGDFAWLGNGPDGPAAIGCERKTISDLVSSIDSGRLSGSQLLGLLPSYWRTILIVEGIFRPNPANGVLQVFKHGAWVDMRHGRRRYMLRTITNFLHSMAVNCGILVARTSTIEETGMYLSDIYNWWQKGWSDHAAHLAFYSYAHAPSPVVQLFRPPLVARVAKEITDVGWTRAQAIAAKYASVLELVMAGEKELMAVEGVGKGIARTIVKELSGGK
jgi:ERCC4-type nuclease